MNATKTFSCQISILEKPEINIQVLSRFKDEIEHQMIVLGADVVSKTVKKSKGPAIAEAAESDEPEVEVDADDLADEQEDEAPVAPPAKSPAKAKAEKPVSADDVKAACLKYTKARSLDETVAVLKKVGGAGKVNLIDAAKYPAVLKALKV